MANIRVTALLTKLRAVIEGDATVAKAMTAMTEAPPQLSDQEASKRALVNVTYDVSLDGPPEPHPNTPPHISSLIIYNVRPVVEVTRHMSSIHAHDDDARDSVVTLAARDGDVLGQVLTYPGNLTNDVLGASLGLASGCLFHESSEVGEVKLGNDKTMLVRTRHVFTGVLYADRS